MRLVVNKEATADTASFLFQVGFSGRAEFGLTGSDAFGIKVSADGSSWVTAMTLDGAGRWLSGVDVAVPVFPNDVLPSLQLHGNSIGQTAMLGARWSNDGNAPQYVLAKSRSTTFGAAGVPVQSGDVLGSYVCAGDNGAQLVQAAEIRAIATGGWSSATGRSARLELRLRDQDSLTARARFDADGSFRLLNLATTASGANAFLNAGDGNNLLRSTSSVRYKRDVEDLTQTAADRVLSLRPVRYHSTAGGDRPDWTYYGLIAEEVAAVDPRLVHWAYPEAAYNVVVEPDPDNGADVARRVLRPGAEQVPEGVQYDRVAVLLLGIVKRQEARIAALEARLSASSST